MLAAFEADPEMCKTEKVRIDMLRRFGYYSTESNGHLSEYVPWFRKRPAEIAQWIDLGCWINGETGGYLRVCTEGRNWFEHDFPNWMAGAAAHLRPGGSRLTSTAPISSKGWKRDAATAAISMWSTAAASPTCRRMPSWKCPATWITTA